MLTLVIGANGSVITLLDRLLLRPFPGVAQLDRLAYIDLHSPGREDWAMSLPLETFLTLRRHATQAAGVGAWATGSDLTLQEGAGEVMPVPVMRFSHDLLSTLGLRLALGRSFGADEDRSGGAPAMILGHSLWKMRFGGSPAVLGRSFRVDGIERIVVGLLPPMRVPHIMF